MLHVDSRSNFSSRQGKQHFLLKKSNVSLFLINFSLLSKLGCESEALVARRIETLDLVLLLTATQANLIKISSDMF